MNMIALAFAQQMFRLRIHESTGQKYEDLFVDVMRRAYKNFKPVKPHGPLGDRKNDGFDSSTGAYYQIFSPEDIRRSQAQALKKLIEDFAGLTAFWDEIFPVRRFYFVINDRYHGGYPDLYQELASIKTKQRLEDSGLFLVQDLEVTLFSLQDQDIFALIGYVPVIEPADFLFLSGFTCFAHSWIEFERACGHLGYPVRIHPNHVATRELFTKSYLTIDEVSFLDNLRRLRNPLFHGDSTALPSTAEIDQLTVITKRLNSQPAQPTVPRLRHGP